MIVVPCSLPGLAQGLRPCHSAMLVCQQGPQTQAFRILGWGLQVALVGVLGVHHVRRHNDAAGVHWRPALHHRPGALPHAGIMLT
jgi:hypothetical protein